METVRRMAILITVCLSLSAGPAQAEILYRDHLVNPSFQEGEEGQEPRGWASESNPSGDPTSFVKAKGGRPKGEGNAPDGCAAQLTVKGDDTSAWGSQIISVKIDEPTQFTFSIWVKSHGTIPPGDCRPALLMSALTNDAKLNRWVKTEGTRLQGIDFVPTPEWTNVSLSATFPPTVQRIKLVVQTYSRDVIISVDDAALVQGIPVPDFDVEKESKDVAALVAEAGEDSEKAAELQKLFDAIEKRMSTANDQSAPQADRKKAAGDLPELIQDFFEKKGALKKSLLDSLFE